MLTKTFQKFKKLLQEPPSKTKKLQAKYHELLQDIAQKKQKLSKKDSDDKKKLEALKTIESKIQTELSKL